MPLSQGLIFHELPIDSRSGYSSISSLLSLPTSHAPLVDVIGGRWVSGRQTKCAKILVQFLETLEKKTGDK